MSTSLHSHHRAVYIQCVVNMADLMVLLGCCAGFLPPKSTWKRGAFYTLTIYYVHN